MTKFIVGQQYTYNGPEDDPENGNKVTVREDDEAVRFLNLTYPDEMGRAYAVTLTDGTQGIAFEMELS
jgi:hypothetical protein